MSTIRQDLEALIELTVRYWVDDRYDILDERHGRPIRAVGRLKEKIIRRFEELESELSLFREICAINEIDKKEQRIKELEAENERLRVQWLHDNATRIIR